MLSKFRKSEKGFTLIELLIVVAIIGILAAIAIPQFASYRQRAFNSAATSDVRNLATTQEALFADTQGYGTLDATEGGANLAAADALATATSQVGPMEGALVGTAGAFVHNTLGASAITISNGVTLVCDTDVVGVSTAYVAGAKHVDGDGMFARESDSSSLYRAAGVVGTPIVVADIPAAATGAIEVDGFANVATNTYTGM